MDQPTCQDCLWYIQLYINLGFRYSEINFGMCCRGRSKIRKYADPICRRYFDKSAAPPDNQSQKGRDSR